MREGWLFRLYDASGFRVLESPIVTSY